MFTPVSVGNDNISVSIGLYIDFERQYLPPIYLIYWLSISPFLPHCLFCWLVDTVELLENEFISDVMSEWSFCFVDKVGCLYFSLIGLYGNLGENNLLSGHFMFAIPLAFSWI